MDQIRYWSVLLFFLIGIHHSPAHGKVYYLSPDGTDRSDCTGGTREDPWRTWRGIMANECISAGDTVFLMKGSYYSGSDFFQGGSNTYLSFNGTGDNPVVLAADPDALSEWPARLVGEVDLGGNGGVLLGLEVYGNGEQPIEVHGSHFIIRECFVHGRPEDIDVNGSKITGYDCIKILSGSTSHYHDIQVIDNTICDCAEDAIDVTGARNLLYRGNHIYNARFIQVKGGTEDIVIEQNRIHKLHTGIIAYRMACSNYCGSPVLTGLPVEERFAARNVTIRNNLIYDIRRNEAIGARGWQNARIYHNTIYQTTGHPILELGSTGLQFFDDIARQYCQIHSCKSCGDGCVYIDFPSKDVRFRNNIIYTIGGNGIDADADAVSGFVSESNIWYDPGEQISFSVGSQSYDLDNFPYESGSYFADPGLADPASGDLSISVGSFAVDRAALTDVFDDFNGYYRDENPDIGAYEYGGSPPEGDPRVSMTILADQDYLVANDPVEIRVELLHMEGMTSAVTLFFNDSAISVLEAEPWIFTWAPEAVGNFDVFVRAADTAGIAVDSRRYQVEVLPSLLPEVHISTPVTGTEFEHGSDIGIGVEARDPDGTITLVELYLDSIKLGEGTGDSFFFDWLDAEDGEYVLKASATDNTDQIVWSDPVLILVKEKPFNYFYQEDFNDGMAQDWYNPAGTWSVKDSSYRVEFGSGTATGLYNGSTFQDIRFSARARSMQNDYFGLIFNYMDGDNYLSVGLVESPPIVVLRKTLNGTTSKLVQSYFPPVESGSWLNIRLTNREGRTSFSIDDNSIFQNVATPDLLQGRIGFFAENNHAYFDDVDVAARTAGPYTGLDISYQHSSHGVMVTPNPVCGKEFAVTVRHLSGDTRLEIYDLYGRLIHHCMMKESRIILSTEMLGQPGIYLLKVPNGRASLIYTHPH